MGPLTAMISTFNPSARFSSLLDFARILLSCTKVRRNKLHPFSKISADVFSLLYFTACAVGVGVICSGFLEAGFRKSFRLRPTASSMGVLPLKVTCAVLTVAALRINWAGVSCARVVWSKFLEVVSTSAKRIFVNSRTPISARFGNGVCGAVGIVFVLCNR